MVAGYAKKGALDTQKNRNGACPNNKPFPRLPTASQIYKLLPGNAMHLQNLVGSPSLVPAKRRASRRSNDSDGESDQPLVDAVGGDAGRRSAHLSFGLETAIPGKRRVTGRGLEPARPPHMKTRAKDSSPGADGRGISGDRSVQGPETYCITLASAVEG